MEVEKIQRDGCHNCKELVKRYNNLSKIKRYHIAFTKEMCNRILTRLEKSNNDKVACDFDEFGNMY